MKKLHRVPLVAVDACGLPVRSDNCSDRVMFIARPPSKLTNLVPYFVGDTEFWKLVTNTGEYVLRKHIANNYWFGTCAGIKVQVSLKRMVGELRYWA